MVDSPPDAVLLDRDGTINVKAREGAYITDPDDVELLPGAATAIRALNRAHVPVIVVTNQRGIALGRMTESDLAAVHARLRELLERRGARLDAIFHCPHDQGVCACRKPGTLLLERARDHLGLSSLRHTLMVGDSLSDVQAGRAAGARTMLISRGRDGDGDGDGERDGAGLDIEVASSLLEAIKRALSVPAPPAPPAPALRASAQRT